MFRVEASPSASGTFAAGGGGWCWGALGKVGGMLGS